MIKHLQLNTGCPCCRTTLLEVSEDGSVEEDEDEDEDEDIDSDEEEESENEYPIESLVATFEAKGYGLKDALSLLMYNFSKTDPLYTKQYIRQLEADIDDMNEDLQDELDERIGMAEEDTNILL